MFKLRILLAPQISILHILLYSLLIKFFIYFLLLFKYSSVRMAIINKSTNKCWRGCGEKGTLLHCWWECRLVQPLWKTVWNFLRKLEMELPFDPAIPLLGVYRKNTETPIQKNLCFVLHRNSYWLTQQIISMCLLLLFLFFPSIRL